MLAEMAKHTGLRPEDLCLVQDSRVFAAEFLSASLVP